MGPNKVDNKETKDSDDKGDKGSKGTNKPKKVVVKKISKKEMKQKVKAAKQKVAKKIINKMGDKQMVISQSSAFKPTRASKSRLIKRRDELIKKYKL